MSPERNWWTDKKTSTQLPKAFYLRDSKEVARNLIGKIMIKNKMGGIIKETEAYFGEKDPASRGYRNRRTKISKWLWKEGGTILVYKVHGHCLLNVIADKKGIAGGVLFRELKPLWGEEEMKRNRGRPTNLTDGPGKLSESLGIDTTFNGKKIYAKDSPIKITEHPKKFDFEVKRGWRIGVSNDLDEKLRFYMGKGE